MHYACSVSNVNYVVLCIANDRFVSINYVLLANRLLNEKEVCMRSGHWNLFSKRINRLRRQSRSGRGIRSVPRNRLEILRNRPEIPRNGFIEMQKAFFEEKKEGKRKQTTKGTLTTWNRIDNSDMSITNHSRRWVFFLLIEETMRVLSDREYCASQSVSGWRLQQIIPDSGWELKGRWVIRFVWQWFGQRQMVRFGNVHWV